MSLFWNTEFPLLSAFVFLAYLLVLFQVVGDLCRDTELSGFYKVLWFIGLVFLPFVTAFLYFLARGRGMAERQRAAVLRARLDTDAYIREVAGAGKSPADQIAAAKALLDVGTINKEEFEQLKHKALAA
jgi:hypothetical protein